MRLQSHLNRKQRGRKQRAEGREQNRARAVLLELFVYFLCHIVCLGDGWVECASTRELEGHPLRPHPKKFIKIGLRPIAWTAIFATAALRIGVPLEPFMLVEKAELPFIITDDELLVITKAIKNVIV